jgi:hypothetical protein
MAKIRMRSVPKPGELQPTIAGAPRHPAQAEAEWEFALRRPCPRCGQPVDEKCFSMAPSHAAAGVRYATQRPHKERLK